MITKNEFYGAYLIACNDNVPDPTAEALSRLTSEIDRAWGVVEELQKVPDDGLINGYKLLGPGTYDGAGNLIDPFTGKPHVFEPEATSKDVKIGDEL